MEKQCSGCNLVKSISEFYKWAYSKDGYTTYCKECKSIKASEHYNKHKIFHKLKHKEYYLRIKDEVFSAYGNRCKCCGLEDVRFLTIDHIGGKDNVLRKYVSVLNEWLYIKKQGFPKDKYRLLCHNCNQVIRYGMICPHIVDRLEKHGKFELLWKNRKRVL